MQYQCPHRGNSTRTIRKTKSGSERVESDVNVIAGDAYSTIRATDHGRTGKTVRGYALLEPPKQYRRDLDSLPKRG